VTNSLRFLTLNPGHFHAALVQKEMYPGVAARVYAAMALWYLGFPDRALRMIEDATELSAKTLKNLHAVGAIEKSRRRDDVEFGLHEVVAGLQPEDQGHWLEEAASHGWDRNELRGRIRASKRLLVIEGRASGMFTVEVTVWVDVTAQNEVKAEETAWDQVKRAIQHLDQPRVIASHVRAEAARKRG
jgi:hypothetical protein